MPPPAPAPLIRQSLGRISGSVWGAASSYDAALSSGILRYGIMGGSAAAALWGMSDPGGMFGLRGAVGLAGVAGAGFAGLGRFANSEMGQEFAGSIRGAYAGGVGTGMRFGSVFGESFASATGVGAAKAGGVGEGISNSWRRYW